MILQLIDTNELRSYLDTRTADVILHALDIGFYGDLFYYEVIVRGNNSVDARHVDCKKQVARTLRGTPKPKLNAFLKSAAKRRWMEYFEIMPPRILENHNRRTQ